MTMRSGCAVFFSSSSSSSTTALGARLAPARTVATFADARRRRLLYNVRRRGTRENIVLLYTFAAARLGAFSERELDEFEALLELTDPDLFDVMMSRASPASERLAASSVLAELRAFAVNGRPKIYD